MSNPPPVEFQPGMEIVPGYTLISPLGSGMAGDVWKAQAAGGIKVALKVVRSLSDLGGRKELKALKTIRDVHHPNLCPLFGFWTKDADGRVLADGETEDLTFDSVSGSGVAQVATPVPPGAPDPGAASVESGPADGTMAIGSMNPYPSYAPTRQPTPDKAPAPPKRKVTAEQLIVVMGLGDCTLYDRLKFVRHEAGLGPEAADVAFGLDSVETIRYLRASASAIDLLNREHRIYHCDIKPQNILLVGGEAQVCDFGLAKQIEGDMRQTQHAFATPAYAPPEVLHGEGYSQQIDQYSLAVTYYELRTGLLPFDITTHASMLVAKSTGKLDLNALTPPERKVLQKALRRVPNERYDSCTQFINALAVASGVEKSGGITVRRIVAAVFAFILVLAASLGGWRYIDPEGSDWIFDPTGAQTADNLIEAQDSFLTTESQTFETSELMLTGVMEKCSDISVNSKDDRKADADTLFADAALRLISRIHETLRIAESQNGLSIGKSQGDRLQRSLVALDPDSSEQNSSIGRGIQDWSVSEDQDRRDAYNRFLSLYYSGAVRFHLLSGTESSPEHIDGLRKAVDERPESFSAVAAVDLTFASLLPVLATTPNVGFGDWSPQQWLEDPRLDDLIRAETSGGNIQYSEEYGRRWKEIRDAFTVKVAPEVTGSVSHEKPLDQETQRKILDGFPDLEVQKMFAELRASVLQSEWDKTESLLNEANLSGQSNRHTAERSAILATIGALAKHRDADDALALALRSINDSKISFSQLREMRAKPLFSSYMRMIGNRAIMNASQSKTGFHTQVDDAQRIKQELDVPIPNEFLAAAAISLLRERPELITGGQPEDVANLENWIGQLADVTESASLAIAIRIEQQIAAERPDKATVDSAMLDLQSCDQSYLSLVAKHYADYLLACGTCLKGEDVDQAAKRLTAGSRQSIKSLGETRLRSGTLALVRGAVKASAVDDDDLEVLRYSKGSAVTRSRAYLKLAGFLIGHTDEKTIPEFENERLVLGATTGAYSSEDEIPKTIIQRLASPDTANELSNQVLKAIHVIGLKQLTKLDATSERSSTMVRLLIRPANVMIERYGRDQFGPKTGPSKIKDAVAKAVVYPTVTQSVSDILKFDRQRMIPTGVSPLAENDKEAFIRFCGLASIVYTDKAMATLYEENQYEENQSYLEHCITIDALASTASSLSTSAKQDLLLRVADSAIASKTATGDQLLDVASVASKKYLANTVTTAYLKSVANEKISDEATEESEHEAHLQLAFELSVDALEALGESERRSERMKRLFFELHARSADLGVRLAFLKPLEDKLAILEPSRERAKKAVEIYNARWVENVTFTLPATYITLGNACEDIAHYCSQGDETEVVDRREVHFQLAIDAFREANRRNSDDIKTRFSLGRCQYRYAVTLDDELKELQFQNAQESLGQPPQQNQIDQGDRYVLESIAEWFVWKFKVEFKLGNSIEVFKFAKIARGLVENEDLNIDVRSDLAQIVGFVYGDGGRRAEAADWLTVLEGRGRVRSVILRMGTLSDVAFTRRSPDKSLFTTHLRTLDLLPKTGNLPNDDHGTYELAKIATRCVRERIVDLFAKSSRITTSKLADLAKGVRAFDEQLSNQSPGVYRNLADVFVEGDVAAENRDPELVFLFACDLASMIDSIPDSPSYAKNPKYIFENSLFIVLNSLSYFGKEVSKLPDAQKQGSMKSAARSMSDERYRGITNCLNMIARLANNGGNRMMAQQAEIALKMVDEIKGSL